MENEKLLSELKESFEKTKKELGFKSSFEDVDNIFFLREYILKSGFVSTHFSRQLCACIVDTYVAWNNYLNGLLMPNPHYLVGILESQMLDEEEGKEIQKLVTESVVLASMNTLVGLTKEKKAEAEFIDSAVEFWRTSFRPRVIKIMKKINSSWKEKASKGE